MNDIVKNIREELKRREISEAEIARRIGLPEQSGQKKVNNLLRGVTKRLDLGFIELLQKELGIAEKPVVYGVSSIVRAITTEQEELLSLWDRMGEEERKALLTIARSIGGQHKNGKPDAH